MEALKSLYESAKGSNEEGKSKLGVNFLYVDCRQKWTLDLIDKLAKDYILPKDMVGVGIGYLDEKWEPVKRFLNKCIKNDLEWLWINYVALDKWEKQYRLGIDEYVSTITVAAENVTKWLGVNYFKIDSDQFAQIVRASKKNKEKLDFDNSSLKFEEFMDFGSEKYQISKITMEDTFIKNKKGKEIGVKNLIASISKSTLKDSLQELWRGDCNVETETVETIVKEVMGEDWELEIS